MSSNLTGYIDLAQILLYVFWIFFFGLILHLRKEDKREGYPMEADPANPSEMNKRMVGFPDIPSPKEFRLADGSVKYAPRSEKDTRELKAEPIAPWPGAPLSPTGDPMQDGVGPSSYAQRENKPELNLDGKPRIVPMRVEPEWHVAEGDTSPVGMSVYGADDKAAGKVVDIWVDRAEPKICYYEVELNSGGAKVLLPFNFTRVDTYNSKVNVVSIMSDHFANVPQLQNPDQITSLEEEKIMAYYGGGHLYATPARQEPWL